MSVEMHTADEEYVSPMGGHRIPQDGDLDGEIPYEGPRIPRRKKPVSLPKNLTYDGRGNWSAFKQKFYKYAEAYGWADEDCQNCLCWALTDRAADFHATLTEQNEDFSFRGLMRRLEKRFGSKELPETAQARFSDAMQQANESLEEWSDRVMTLATRAFRDLPERYSNQQAVVRFCQGLYDKEAAHDASMQRLRTMEEALDHVKWFQHIHSTIYGSRNRSRRSRDSEDIPAVYETRRREYDDRPRRRQDFYDEPVVYETRRQWGPTESPATYDVRRPESRGSLNDSELGQVVLQLTEKMKELTSEMSEMKKGSRKTEVTSSGKAGGPLTCWVCGSKSHMKKNCPNFRCFECDAIGHAARDCPKRRDNKTLNGNGLRQ